MRIRPIASGILVVPVEYELMNSDEEGKKYPIDTPNNMAKKIHRVKYRSRNPNFFLSFAGAQL
jgi:hypothetical protein